LDEELKTSSPCEDEIIALGAEALLKKIKFLQTTAVAKVRIRKRYRDLRLDKILRRQRTVTEAKIMTQLRAKGVKVPALLYVDPEEGILIMEYVDGSLLRDLVKEGRLDEACQHMKQVGKYSAIMHKAGISHGDLTTANVVVSHEGVPYLIDFGLAKFTKKEEDFATDLHLLIRVLESAHFRYKDKLLSCFLTGYSAESGADKLNALMELVKEIRMRGRYVEERRKRSEG